jgi:hypothetical protein
MSAATSYRPSDMGHELDEPILAATVVLLVCKKNLAIRMEKVARAEKLMARAVSIAREAQEEADHAIELYMSALWELAEAKD